MKTKLLPVFVLAAGFVAVGARAQTSTPTTPAPAVETLIAPAASQFVYSPRLPSAAELTNVAAAQGLAIDKIVQSASQMTVVYRSANGQTNTVAYMLLPAAGAAPATTVVATTAPAPRVVYTAVAPAPDYYYDPFYYPSYYAGPWYGPVSVNLGWGFGYRGGGGWRGGGWHGGGWHGSRGGRHWR